MGVQRGVPLLIACLPSTVYTRGYRTQDGRSVKGGDMMFGSVRGRGGIRLAGVRISMEGWGGMPERVALYPIIPPPASERNPGSFFML